MVFKIITLTSYVLNSYGEGMLLMFVFVIWAVFGVYIVCVFV